MNKIKRALFQILHSLMMQLTFHHFKKNLALLTVWIIIIAAFSGGLGKVYGIHYLFLDPEYLGSVSFWSFFIVGLAFGNLIMAWHITTYILDGHRFRFVGVLQRPFTKFSINNSLIPLLILAIYIAILVSFQVNNGLAESLEIALYVLGLLLGIISMHLLMILYFRFTNKDIFIFLAGTLDRKLRKNVLSRDRVMNKVRENRADKYNVTNYLDLKLKVRSTEHIVDFGNKEAVIRVFDQNHFNSVVVELCIIGVILLLGFFMDIEYLQIPAAASSLLIFAIAVMLVGAISYWFKGWGLAFALGVFILVNAGVKVGLGKGINQAAGLNYDTIQTNYSVETLLDNHSKEQFVHDKLHMLQTLENWKQKWENPKDQKMVFLCVSGGGQRAALWAVNSLLKADSALNGSLMDQTVLITGASGGVIGAAYYREMFRRNSKIALSEDRHTLLANMGKDNLNPVIFGLLVNDLFFKIRTHEYAGRTYSVDRGFVFERNLNKNLGHTLNKQIKDYKVHEEQAQIPTLIMSPTIANDGRKLYISSQPVSFMSVSSQILDGKESKVRAVDFQSFFKAHSPEDLSFLSALRMSASFPYITPNISLPAEPRVEIMDAGISDNFGISDAIRFIGVFEDWILENTDGVVFLVVRDTKSNEPIEKRPNPSVIDRLTYPIASVYNNLTNMQDINNDIRLEQMNSWFEGDIDVVEIAYDSFQQDENTTDVERASLSWHLTTKEKQHILENIHIESNKKSIRKLQRLLKNSSNP
ncbi:Patatin-like phospholipase [Ekhidna lutea]|uniref:Patatin-like phospholipase n=1 Tax=Ekhidna lutea TaxID=447679 RepID=A0A239HH67_EKHLU|nr:patatin-like phospholipase family protein [Ekhidna lutea]SNS80766.1 Patatin-like phospholipase [Ekhidna lutea]